MTNNDQFQGFSFGVICLKTVLLRCTDSFESFERPALTVKPGYVTWFQSLVGFWPERAIFTGWPIQKWHL